MTPTDNNHPARGRSDWPTLLIVAVCAAAAGVLGTLLFTKGGAPHTAATPPAAASAPGAPHQPPPELTAGKSPAEAEVITGNWFYDHKEWPEAIEHYENAVTGGMDTPDIHTDLGSAYRFNGQPDKALEQYAIAQKKDPNHEASLFNEASVYAFTLGQPDKAMAIWKEYLKRFPNGKNTAQVREFVRKMEAGEPMQAPAGP